MKTIHAHLLCAGLAILFAGVFWFLTGINLNSHLDLMRIGFTISFGCLGYSVGCFIQIMALGK